MIELEIIDENSQVIEALLDGETFYIVLNWNDSNQSWTWGARNANYEALILGVALVVNYPLTKRHFAYRALWNGELYAAAIKDRNGPIPRDGFVTEQYKLIYVTEAEWNAV